MTNGIVCPFCGRPAVFKETKSWEDAHSGYMLVSYQCPENHLRTGWYAYAETAFEAWMRLVETVGRGNGPRAA